MMAAALACAGASACGGGNSPSSVTIISRSTGAAGQSGATITISNGAASPRTVAIAVGQSVTFVNNDTRPHEMASDPHPQHGSCPAMEQGLGTLAAGQTKLTLGFADRGTCGFHDHLDDGNSALRGTITIQ